MTLKEAQRRLRLYEQLAALGIPESEAKALQRASHKLQAWHELQCGTDRGAVEQVEATGKWLYCSADYTADGKPRWTQEVPDRGAQAERAIARVMALHPGLAYRLQGDPRGCPLHVGKAGDMTREEGGIPVW